MKQIKLKVESKERFVEIAKSTISPVIMVDRLELFGYVKVRMQDAVGSVVHYITMKADEATKMLDALPFDTPEICEVCGGSEFFVSTSSTCEGCRFNGFFIGGEEAMRISVEEGYLYSETIRRYAQRELGMKIERGEVDINGTCRLTDYATGQGCMKLSCSYCGKIKKPLVFGGC